MLELVSSSSDFSENQLISLVNKNDRNYSSAIIYFVVKSSGESTSYTKPSYRSTSECAEGAFSLDFPDLTLLSESSSSQGSNLSGKSKGGLFNCGSVEASEGPNEKSGVFFWLDWLVMLLGFKAMRIMLTAFSFKKLK